MIMYAENNDAGNSQRLSVDLSPSLKNCNDKAEIVDFCILFLRFAENKYCKKFTPPAKLYI